LYASGRAGHADAATAYAWILAATLSGDVRGKEYLVSLEKQLNAQQLARAKEKAQELQAMQEHMIPELAFVR
jgi:hypothetical protein